MAKGEPRYPWRLDTNDRYREVVRTIISLSTASLAVPVFFLRNILSITGPHTKAYIVIPFADKVTQYSKQSWAYPMQFVKSKIENLGGMFEYIETKSTFQSKFVDAEIKKVWVKITRSST